MHTCILCTGQWRLVCVCGVFYSGIRFFGVALFSLVQVQSLQHLIGLVLVNKCSSKSHMRMWRGVCGQRKERKGVKDL